MPFSASQSGAGSLGRNEEECYMYRMHSSLGRPTGMPLSHQLGCSMPAGKVSVCQAGIHEGMLLLKDRNIVERTRGGGLASSSVQEGKSCSPPIPVLSSSQNV